MDTPPEKILFTPGPLTTSPTVKEAMLRDVGSRTTEFIELVADIRARLLSLAGTSVADGFEAVPLQGSGTYALEAVCASGIPVDGELLVLVNGAYGRRMAKIARTLGIPVWELDWDEDQPVDPASVDQTLAQHPEISHVALVHCETTTGILNPLEEIARIVHDRGRSFIVDAMSSFGALPIDLGRTPVDFLVSSSNKCLEGVPGFAFVIFRREALEAAGNPARSVSLDLLDQWKVLDETGQFRFTPPTHALLAFAQALHELAAEGGPEARGRRYAECQRMLTEGMVELGFQPYLDPEHQSPVITTFRYHPDPAFQFQPFYESLAERGFVLYPGKLAEAEVFRIGTAGKIGVEDVLALLVSIRMTLEAMGVDLASLVTTPSD